MNKIKGVEKMNKIKGVEKMNKIKEEIERHVARTELNQFCWGDVTEFISLTTVASFMIEKPDGLGGFETKQVAGRVWSKAIMAALDKYQTVKIPPMDEVMYLDQPLVLRSGQRLWIDNSVILALVPGSNTCMIRNEHLVNGHPSQPEAIPDTDISICGGIWTTFSYGAGHNNGNEKGHSDSERTIPGSFGIMLFNNVERLQITDLVIRQGNSFGIQLSCARCFYIENITFDRHHKDGVHINGQAEYGILRNLSGDTGDDMVALNAWDWVGSATTFGCIRYLLVQNITGKQNEIRLLPGRKKHTDGSESECAIEHCIFEKITGIYNFKLYCQPNCHNVTTPQLHDYSVTVGEIRDVWFQDIVFDEILQTGLSDIPVDGLFELGCNVTGIHISHVVVNGEMEKVAFLTVGPKSVTWKYRPEDPSSWGELFAPNAICNVDGVTLDHICFQKGYGGREITPQTLVKEICLSVNPDYPNTVPAGGKGYGIVRNVVVNETTGACI